MPDPKNQKIIDSYDYLGPACSTMDCTGLIPAGVVAKEELQCYEDVYPYRPPHLVNEAFKEKDDLLPL